MGLQNGCTSGAWCTSPGNTGEREKKIKICSLQDACPRFIWKLQAMSFCKLVSYKMVCLEVSPNCMPPTFPGNFRIFFSQSPKLRQRKGLIIPFLIGPLSGVCPFPHTSMMESQKNMEGNAWILAMVTISYRFLALTEIDLKHCYKMTGPTSFCSKCCLLQNDTPSRKHTSYILLQNGMVQRENFVTKWFRLLEKWVPNVDMGPPIL